MTKKSVGRAQRILENSVALAFWLLVWHLIANAIGKELLLVGPVAAFERLIELAGTRDFYGAVATSMRNIVMGFCIAIIAGYILAFLSHFVALVRMLVYPLIRVMRVVPVASLTVLALAFVSSYWLPMYVAILMVLPLVYLNILQGLSETDEGLIEMSAMYRVGRFRQLRLLYVPAVRPYFVSAYETGFGYAWKSAVTAEVVSSATDSIGANIADAKVYFAVDDLFAWTLTIIVFSLLTERFMMLLIWSLRKKAS